MMRTFAEGRTAVIATVMERDGRSAGEAIDRARAAGADAVEVRLDALAPPIAPEEIGDRDPPSGWLLASCRATRDGGGFAGSEGDRVRLLERAAQTGRFLLDIERGSGAEALQETIPDRIAIVSHHDLGGTPADLEDRARDLVASLRTAQIAKLVPTARSLADMTAVRSLLASAREPRLAAFAMGEPGRASRVLAGAWGSAAVWTAAHPGRPGAAGQIDLASLLGIYRFRSITRETIVFGVAGSPVSRSLSPAMHNAAYGWLGLDAVYVPLECSSAEELVAFARVLPLAGISVTSPLKVAIVPFLDRRDPAVDLAGACNTVVDGAGYNTDAAAAIEEIRARIDPAGRRAIVLGGGGAARAVAFALRDAGALLTIVGRGSVSGRSGADEHVAQATDTLPADRAASVSRLVPTDRAERLARELGARYRRIDELEGDAEAILVHATGAPADDPVVPPRSLRAAFLLDLRYTAPGEPSTALVEAARAAGVPSADGLGMLARQAAAQIRLFVGRVVPWQRLLDAVRTEGRT